MPNGAKILIAGLPNTGKTTLLKTLKNAFVVSRDGKPFSLRMPHVNVPEYQKIDDLLDLVQEKLTAYEERFKALPDTICFDSVSRIFTDIEASCSKRFHGYDVWSNVNKEINTFLDALNSMQESGFNLVLIAHAVWDVDAKKFIETCKGSFAKTGGFLSVVDYAIYIDIVGQKRIVTHRGSNLARTLLDEMPDKQDVKDFDLQKYIDAIKSKSTEVQEKWEI